MYVADQLGRSTAVITLRTYAHLFRAAQQEAQAREQLETACIKTSSECVRAFW